MMGNVFHIPVMSLAPVGQRQRGFALLFAKLFHTQLEHA